MFKSANGFDKAGHIPRQGWLYFTIRFLDYYFLMHGKSPPYIHFARLYTVGRLWKKKASADLRCISECPITNRSPRKFSYRSVNLRYREAWLDNGYIVVLRFCSGGVVIGSINFHSLILFFRACSFSFITFQKPFQAFVSCENSDVRSRIGSGTAILPVWRAQGKGL